jgi:hypothetical protein
MKGQAVLPLDDLHRFFHMILTTELVGACYYILLVNYSFRVIFVNTEYIRLSHIVTSMFDCLMELSVFLY